MLDQEGDLTVNPGILDEMVIVQDKTAERDCLLDQGIDQRRNGAFKLLFIIGIQVMVDIIPVRKYGLLEGADEIGPESPRIIVMVVQ